MRGRTADAYQSFAVDDSGGAWGWGWNDYGQLGDGTTTARSQPIALGAMAQTKGLAAGPNHSLGLGPDGSETRSWGWNGTGTLGDGTTTSRLTPTAISQQRASDPVASYAYDGDGLRVARTRAGSSVEMVWDRSGAIPACSMTGPIASSTVDPICPLPRWIETARSTTSTATPWDLCT